MTESRTPKDSLPSSAPTYLCPHGHRLPKRRSVLDPINFSPEACPECYRALNYPLCEHCGKPRLGYRSWRFSEYWTKAEPWRDYCPGCGRLYRQPRNWLLRADPNPTLTPYEMELASYHEDAPKLEQYQLSPDDLTRPVPVTWFQRTVFGVGVLITDSRHPKHAQWQAYQAALLRFSGDMVAKRQELREEESWWRGLSGQQFEHAVGRLLTQRGYNVRHTGGPQDQGADLILDSVKGTIVVQCKAYGSVRVGPRPVRELYGALLHHKAAEAWLVSLEGCSDAAHEFARDKPIKLLRLRSFLVDLPAKD
jgi:HJR/Mrr/RecB family endonuclease